MQFQSSENSMGDSSLSGDLKGFPQSDSHQEPRLDGLRILFAVESTFPGPGGAEAQALKLAVVMRDRGAYVEFVTPRVSASQPLEEVFKDFTVKRVDYPHIRWIGPLFLMVGFARYLRANAERFDAVHVHITYLMAATAGFVRSKTGIPVTTKISGFYEFEGGVLDQSKKYSPLNFFLRRGLRQVDFVQAISEQTREKLLAADFRDKQICFIPNGVDVGVDPLPRQADDTHILGYCGRLREVKGVHVLFDAVAEILKRRPNEKIRVIIAGAGTSQEDLLAQVDRLNIGEYVEWLGLIEDTQSFFRSVDICVQPSFAEGLPNTVMEAMVEQKPVVASDIGGNNDLVTHGVTGLSFPAGDAVQLADQLLYLIDNHDVKNSLALAGRQLIEERYDIEKVVTKLAELYRD
ncbi:MAG: glycosyltransferase family 4 protein [Granulosicoccus sp.]